MLGGVKSAHQFISKVFDEVEVLARCEPVRFFLTKLGKNVTMDVAEHERQLQRFVVTFLKT